MQFLSFTHILQSKPPGRPGASAAAENGRSKQANENRKKISHLRNVDSKLANHIMDEIIERYVYMYLYFYCSHNFILFLIFCYTLYMQVYVYEVVK